MRISQPYLAGYSLRTRLYAIIGFLALLPVWGTFVAAIAFHKLTDDGAALDRAARGTIYLERINGLVYAIVMESRGIYMSPDWPAAEKFADNLLPELARLREVASAWKEEAVASQESNVDELGRRIEHFIRFRTELVRLGKEDSTAAARAFGDNAANRDVRTALNQSLTILAQAYEQEIGRARAKVDDDERTLVTALAGLAMVALIAFGSGIVLVRRSLVAPLLRLKSRMLRLAGGDLDHPVDGHERAGEIAEMAETVEIFRCDLVDRQRLNHEGHLLASLNEWLQSCNSLSELYEMVALFLARLLPGCSGNLFIYANSRDVLESAKVWNGATLSAAMHPDDCWALRRGRTYTFGEGEIDFPCAHVAASETQPYCCIPILAHGETVGLLHLTFGVAAAPADDTTADSTTADSTTADGKAADAGIAEQRRLAMVCAENISLAIANVKLRDQLRDQSIRDPLTGLFNRRYLLETCRREFLRATRAGLSVSMLSIDVDHFKKFNDNQGHDAGDTVLRAVGRCLEGLFRAEDVPCRFGGEEFVVLLPGSNLDAAAGRAEQLRKTVEALVVRYLDRNLPTITISIGVAAFPISGDTPQTVMRVADEALYRAKANGRNRVELATGPEGDDNDAPAPPANEVAAAAEGSLAAAAD